MHASGTLVASDRNPVTTSSSKKHAIASCNLKSREWAVLRHSWIPGLSNVIWILNLSFHLSFLPSSILTYFTSRLSPRDGEHGCGLAEFFFSYGLMGRESICFNSLNGSPRVSLVWVTCPHATARWTWTVCKASHLEPWGLVRITAALPRVDTQRKGQWPLWEERQMNKSAWYSVFLAKVGGIEDAGEITLKEHQSQLLEVGRSSYWKENCSHHYPCSTPVMMSISVKIYIGLHKFTLCPVGMCLHFCCAV